MSESPYKFYEDNTNNYLIPFGLNKSGMDYTLQNKQSLSNVWIPNGYVDIVKSENILKNKDLFGKNILKFGTDPYIEIDSSEELEFLKYYRKKR